MQRYGLFLNYQIFFNFFYTFFHFMQTYLYMQAFPWSSLFWWSCVPVESRQSYARAYIRRRTHIHAREFLDRKFLDYSVIFRRIGIFILILPIGIFGTQTAIFRLQQHKFSIKSKKIIWKLNFNMYLCCRNQIKQHYETPVSKQLQAK